ncbi:MAG: thioredoxin domain-containing protein [Candidatus Peribacteraceae bacterium]
MRIILTLSLLCLVGCSLPAKPTKETEINATSSISSLPMTDEAIGKNEVTPENSESLEVEDVPADETGLIAIAIGEEGTVILGNPDAPRLTLFTDYTCEHCSDVSRNTVPWILDTYVLKGTFALEIAMLPITEAGVLSAKTALCAAAQDIFSPADKELYEAPLTSTKELSAFAKKIGADATELAACVNDPEVNAIIGLHRGIAEERTVERVPAFSLNGHTWLGVATKEGLQAEIETGMRSR